MFLRPNGKDAFMKKLFVAALREKSENSVAQTLLRIFLQYGFYPIIKSDHGIEFRNAIM
jgi:diketogulonate reductase-like aldo/keto reductase